ncbi:hypothetical protein OSB04_018883 [Centaurea solstitialis]|uniref:Uncharacterized protein n=1 Tax=Centaurea solstitialis TaxID=347529 RepID=A0AA38T1H5_9ASTR|nr:hypothetical protein OSB04_018883 [Centaurea solstitialis]
MVTHPPLINIHDGVPLANLTEYRALVGRLQLNVAFDVNHLSQYMHQPTNLHSAVLKCLLPYLNGTTHHELILHPTSPHSLHVFRDADWVGSKQLHIYNQLHCLPRQKPIMKLKEAD